MNRRRLASKAVSSYRFITPLTIGVQTRQSRATLSCPAVAPSQSWVADEAHAGVQSQQPKAIVRSAPCRVSTQTQSSEVDDEAIAPPCAPTSSAGSRCGCADTAFGWSALSHVAAKLQPSSRVQLEQLMASEQLSKSDGVASQKVPRSAQYRRQGRGI